LGYCWVLPGKGASRVLGEWFGWRMAVLKKPVNLPNFSKLFEIVRKKAKFPQRRGPNSPKFFEIHRNSSKLFETQSQGIQGLVKGLVNGLAGFVLFHLAGQGIGPLAVLAGDFSPWGLGVGGHGFFRR